jgi:phosphate butyryltransferase
MPIQSFQQLVYEATWLGPKRIAIAAAANDQILEAAREAQSCGMAHCILVDAPDKLARVAEASQVDISDMTIVASASPLEAAATVVRMVRAGEADVAMKGIVDTSVFLRAALDKEQGLRTGRLFTHVAIYEIPGFKRLLLISDAGVVVAPDLYQKIEIVQNAVEVALRLGIPTPKVAVLAAAELVNPKIPSTLDAANLSKMAERGQIRGALVDGPLALDNAISEESARVKGITGPVAGNADILIVPDIEAGNMLAKGLTYFAGAEMAGIVVGGCAPMVVASRSDSHRTKLVSMALGVLFVGAICQPIETDHDR